MKRYIDSQMKYTAITLACLLIIVSSLLGNTQAVLASSPLPVPLGTAGTFGVLASSAVTNTGNTIVTGDLGVSPGTAVSGFYPPGVVTGTIYTGVGSAAGPAQSALTIAYDNATARTPVIVATELGGTTKTPGVYNSADGTFGITGNLTLDGGGDSNAVWIFQTATTLTTASSSQVILTNGAQAGNVFWKVGSSATLGTYSVFKGTIMAQASITLTTNAALEGRALAREGAVTLDSNYIRVPGAPVQAVVIDTPVPAYAGVTSTHTVTFTTVGALPATGSIAITFPTGFNVAGATLGTVTGPGGGFTLSVSSQTINITRDGTGSAFSAGAVTVPLNNIVNTATPGATYKVTVSTLSGSSILDGPTDSSSFTIKPGATFAPITGPVGTTITVSGTGWTASETITPVTVNGVTAWQNLTVNTSGGLSGTIIVPSTSTGAKDIVITGSSSSAQTFTGAFTITTAMSTFAPTTGAVGATLTITSGTGWVPSDAISSVKVGGLAAANSLTVNSGGVLQGTITVPSGLTPGSKSVVITGAISGAQISGTSLTVVPGMTFTPNIGPIGTVITVSGTGWTASETISSVTVGGTTATNTLSVTSGALAGSITVPAGLTPAGGAKNIVITGATSGAQGFTGAFTVTATATFTPNTGPAGTVISTVTGTGWYPSETISNTTGVTVGGVAATSSLTVNGSGVLSGSITVPSSLTNGIKTIIITGSSSGAQTFSAAFNVTATATINLAQGWNLISLPLVPNDPTIANMIPSNVQAQMTAPYGQIVDLTYLSGGAAAPTWRWWTPGWGGSTFSTMDDGKAYWIYVNQACSFTVTGTACGAASPGAVPPPRAYWMYYSTSYPDGWNLLGFKSSQTSVKASDYLVSLPGGTYSPLLYRYDGAWVSVSASDNLTPGAGYYIRMYSNGSVMPPCN